MAEVHEHTGWMQQLVRNGAGFPRSTLGNVFIVLESDAQLAKLFAFDLVRARSVLMRAPPWEAEAKIGRDVGDHDVVCCTRFLEDKFGLITDVGIVGRAVEATARKNQHDPLRDYLCGLEHDGKKRLDRWAVDLLGVADTPFARDAGVRFLIAAVARALRPGCQVDSALVLEGAQGCGKSSAVRILSRGFFSDDIPDLSNGKESAVSLSGAWFVELAELEGLKRADIAKTKAFITRRFDRFRPPYGKHVEEFPRRCVFVATTNESSYLLDETGNRRFWPLTCGAVKLDALERNADQLWAEAVAAFNAGTHWHLDVSVQAEAREQQDDRVENDPWHAQVAEMVNGRDYATTRDVLRTVAIHAGLQTRTHSMRAASLLRRLGFTRRRLVRIDGVREHRYYRPDALSLPGTTVTTSYDGGDTQVDQGAMPLPSPSPPPDSREMKGEKEESRARTGFGGVGGVVGDSTQPLADSSGTITTHDTTSDVDPLVDDLWGTKR
jgi:predicted P-loop ATPase